MNPSDERERTAPFPGPNAQQQPKRYKFTPEELKVMKECNRESFFQRCLPFSALLSTATFYAIKTGTLSASPRWGAIPKVTAAAVVGFFLGKFSYHKKCMEKFMALPNSKVGQLLRARKAGFYDDQDPASVPNLGIGPFTGITDSYSDISPPAESHDYDSRPSHEGLDDSFRPSMDNPIVLHEQEMPPEQKHVTTYDELRKQNREEYEQKRLAIYRQTQAPKSSASQPLPVTKEPGLSDDYKTPSRKNKYGDSFD